jgi:fibronectin-binding autotransporter adhesin
VTGTNNYTFKGSGSIKGLTGMTVVGPGSLTLSNTTGGNTYTGGTAIQGGSIVLNNNNTLPTAGVVTFGLNASSGTLDLTAYNQTVAGLAVGSGATPINQVITSSFGNPTLTFSGGASAFGGTIQDSTATSTGNGVLSLTVGAGTLDVSSGNPIYTGATTVNGGLLVASSIPNTSGITIGPLGALNLTAAGQTVTTPLSNAGSLSFTATSGTTTLPSLSGGTTSFASAASIASLGNGTVNLANSAVLSVSSGSVTTGGINGSGSLVVGPGMLTLTTVNSYTGGTTVSGGGTLGIINGNNTGAAPATVILNGGVLAFEAGNLDTVASMNANRGITLGPSGGTLAVNFQDTVTGSHVGTEYAWVDNGTIGGSGGLTVTGIGGSQYSTSGASILDLGGTASYSGNTTVSNAVLQVNSGASAVSTPLVNMLPVGTTLNLVNNGVLNIDDQSSNLRVAGLTGDTTGEVGTTNGSSAVVLTLGGGGVYVFPGVIGPLALEGKNGSAAELSLTMAGAGTQILSGVNSYTGATTISSGVLQLGNGGATGSLATGSAITDNGVLAFSRSNTATQGADFSTAAITGSGSLLQMGPGMLVLNAANAYSGGTNITGGVLQLGNSAALGSGGLAANGGTLDLADYSVTLPSLSGIAGAITNSNVSGNGLSTLTVNQATTTTFSGAINNGAGQVALTVTGSGNLVLAGVNGYSGPTTVNNGLLGNHVALTVSGLLSNSPVTVRAGTLQVSGTIGNNVTMSGGAVSFSSLSGAGTPTLSGSLTVTGNSTWYGAGMVAQGVSVQAGAFAINGGTLGSLAAPAVTVANGAALTGVGGRIIGGVTVNGGAAIDFTQDGLSPGSTTILTLGGLMLGDNTANPASLTFNVNTSIAQTADLINLGSGTLTVNPSGATINIAGAALSTGTYPLITFGSLSEAGAITLADPQIGLSELALVTTPNALELSVTGNRTPTLAYWSGNYAASSGGNANWSGFNLAGPVTNWSLDAAGHTDAGQVVGPVTDVVFAASSAQEPINSVLDANYTINSLTMTTTSTVSISGGQNLAINALASGSGGLGYAAGNGIVIQPGAGPLTISASTVIPAASQSWTNNSASLLTISSNVTGAAATGNTAVLTLAGSGSGGSAISGAIGDGAGGGNLALVVNSPNAPVALSGSNTYSGGTTLSAGTVTATNSNPLGAGPVTMSPSAGTVVLLLPSPASTIGSLSNSGAGTSSVVLGNASGGGSSTTLTLAGNNASTTFSGVISDLSLSNSAAVGSLAMAGSSALTLTAANTYTGGTTLSAGTLTAAGNTALGPGPVAINPASGTAVLLFPSPAPTIGSLASSGTGTSSVVLGNASGTGSATALTIAGNNGSTTFSGVVSDLSVSNSAAIGSLVKTGNGALTLTASNTYTGGTTVNSGILSIASSSDGGTSGNLGAVPASFQPANVTLNGGELQFDGLSAYNAVTINNNRGITLGASGGTINVPTVSTGTFAGSEDSVQYQGRISGSGSLVVTGGAGTNATASPYILELGTTNSYTGTTTVNNAVVTVEDTNGTGPNNILPTTTVLNLVNNGWFNLCNNAGNQQLAGLTGDATGMIGTTNGGNAAN